MMMGSFMDRNQYKQLVKVLYCKLPTIDKKLPTFPMVDGCLGQTFWPRTCWPRTFQPRTFRTGLFLGVDVSDRFFYEKYFLCSGYFHKRMNGKTFYCTSYLSTFIPRVKHLCISFLSTFITLSSFICYGLATPRSAPTAGDCAI